MKNVIKSFKIRLLLLSLLFFNTLSVSTTLPNKTISNNYLEYYKGYFDYKSNLSTILNVEALNLKDLPLSFPFDTIGIREITGLFKEIRVFPKYHIHTGIDFAGKKGTPILSSGRGEIVFVGTKSGYGKMVIIQHANNIQTRYSHLLHVNVKLNDFIETGHKIGELGSTGWSTGPHLHYELLINDKFVNPLLLLNSSNITSFKIYKTNINKILNYIRHE